MNPYNIVQDPLCGWILHRLSLMIEKGCTLLLQRLTDAVLSGRIDEPTDRHHYQQCHDALGLFQIQRGG
jgi:hypothetical protein